MTKNSKSGKPFLYNEANLILNNLLLIAWNTQNEARTNALDGPGQWLNGVVKLAKTDMKIRFEKPIHKFYLKRVLF